MRQHRLRKSTRRDVLAGAVSLAVLPLAPGPARATSDGMAEAMAEALGANAQIRPGRVAIVLPELAENGNAVPLRLQVESPMTEADHVKTVYVFSEKNPIAQVARFHLGPRAGTATLRTNIRLAATQTITVIARMSDGTLWSAAAEVIVTQAACIDGT